MVYRYILTDIVSLRVARYANLKLQADELRKQLENKQNTTSAVTENVLKGITQKLWEIIFALDDRARTSARQRCGISSNGKLLLQKITSAVYGNISEFRSTSVRAALEIVDKYQGETENKTVLTSADKSIVAYVTGYVCRKNRDKLQRYCTANEKSTTGKVRENCLRLGNIVNTFSKNLPSVEKQTPSLSYPNLITLTLNRGGITTVDPLTFDFFCSLETSIRPFLNIANFRSSTRKSDS